MYQQGVDSKIRLAAAERRLLQESRIDSTALKTERAAGFDAVHFNDVSSWTNTDAPLQFFGLWSSFQQKSWPS